MPYGQLRGKDIVGISLANDGVHVTYTFPPCVHYYNGYMNDIRSDLRPGHEVAYIVDSSDKGSTRFIMPNRTTGDSHKRLKQHPSILRIYNDVHSHRGHPCYYGVPGQTLSHQPEGPDGISPNGQHIYHSPIRSRHLCRIPTADLLTTDDDTPLAEQAA